MLHKVYLWELKTSYQVIHTIKESVMISLVKPMGFLWPKGTWFMKAKSHYIVNTFWNMAWMMIQSNQRVTRWWMFRNSTFQISNCSSTWFEISKSYFLGREPNKKSNRMIMLAFNSVVSFPFSIHCITWPKHVISRNRGVTIDQLFRNKCLLLDHCVILNEFRHSYVHSK